VCMRHSFLRLNWSIDLPRGMDRDRGGACVRALGMQGRKVLCGVPIALRGLGPCRRPFTLDTEL
jgi:hypothetical protein